MDLNNIKKKQYVEGFKRAIKEIERNNSNQHINSQIVEEKELDKTISQYGILGQNLKNLNFDQKKKFVKCIDKEITIKKKISENYNTEYFVEQERLSLQRKLKYEILAEIEKLSNIANTNSEIWDQMSLDNENKKITTTVILNQTSCLTEKPNLKKHFLNKENIEERKARIKERISEIKNGLQKK